MYRFFLSLFIALSLNVLEVRASKKAPEPVVDKKEIVESEKKEVVEPEEDLKAQFDLALKYLTGSDKKIKKDETKAFELLSQSARQGYTNAQFNLSMMYYMGRGVVKNLIMAYAWMDLASMNFPFYKKARDRVAISMSSDEISTAKIVSQDLAQEVYGQELALN